MRTNLQTPETALSKNKLFRIDHVQTFVDSILKMRHTLIDALHQSEHIIGWIQIFKFKIDSIILNAL